MSDDWGTQEVDIPQILEQAKLAAKHSEFYILAECTSLDEDRVRADIIRFYKKNHAEEITQMRCKIERLLN